MERKVIIHLYWKDLSEAGQETLINGGFEPSKAQLDEEEPVGTIVTNRSEDDLEACDLA